MRLPIPKQLADACRQDPERMAWLERLPETVSELRRRWSLTTGIPFEGGSCAWVAPAMRSDGTTAVLKIAMPHMEGEHEIHGLKFWDGDPTVRLLEADTASNAMLLERCEPGSALRELAESEQDLVLSRLLRRLWCKPPEAHPFRPLETMTAAWRDILETQVETSPDAGLLREALRLLEELPGTAAKTVVLATDLHAGNVLRAQREPWLVIDPKPFVGDPAYDATQHLLNSEARLHKDPIQTVRRFSDMLGVDDARVRGWMCIRLVAEWRAIWEWADAMDVARRLAP